MDSSRFPEGGQYFIIEEDGMPVGCVGLEEAAAGTCYVERLTVLPAFRGRGLGRRLLSHAAECAMHLGSSRLEVGIISDDVRLRDWYARYGFVVTGTRRFPHLPFEVTFMAKDI